MGEIDRHLYIDIYTEELSGSMEVPDFSGFFFLNNHVTQLISKRFFLDPSVWIHGERDVSPHFRTYRISPFDSQGGIRVGPN